jgi:hypothetical protein
MNPFYFIRLITADSRAEASTRQMMARSLGKTYHVGAALDLGINPRLFPRRNFVILSQHSWPEAVDR